MRTYAMRTHWVRRHHHTGKNAKADFNLRGNLAPNAELLLYSENRVLRRLGDSEFDYGLGWNLDLLLRFGIEARARFPLLLHQLAEAGQDKFAVLFGLFVRQRAKCIEKRSSRLLVCLSGLSECNLKFCFGHL